MAALSTRSSAFSARSARAAFTAAEAASVSSALNASRAASTFSEPARTALVAGMALGTPGLAGELAPPVRLEAGGKPIDTDKGHAAPWVTDFDGDGFQDLLVGQFGGGSLWICRNEGTNAQPRLAAPEKFKQGKEDGRVPSG